MNRRGLPIVLPRPPLLAFWYPHVGWGTPLAVLCVLLGLRLQQLVKDLPWRRLLLSGWLLNLSWMCSLTLVDGLQRGWITYSSIQTSTCTICTESLTRSPSCRALRSSSPLDPASAVILFGLLMSPVIRP
jgi:hypothetical protein